MRCEHDVRLLSERVVRRQGFLLIRIDHCSEKLLVVECLEQCFFVKDPPASHVDHIDLGGSSSAPGVRSCPWFRR